MTGRSSYLGLVALLCACAGTPKQVVSVARGDLGCDQVEITKVADNRYVGVGCGHVRTYAELCGPGGCSWVRLRDDDGGSSGGVAQGGYAPGSNPTAPPAPREVVQAPPPEQREIIQAPPPGQSEPRQVIPAPPPASSEAATPADPNATTPQSFTPEATPLSQGELSTPYQTEVPAEPVVQRVAIAPPVALVEDRPIPPAPNYVWVSGYWWWNTPRWVWVTGYWCPPRRGYAYVPGSWYWSSNYWWYGPGGWARPGSTYIAYRLPPRSNRVIVTRGFAPHRATALGSAPLRGSEFGLSRAPSRVGAPANAPRGFAPQGSPLHRYPSHLGASRANGQPSYSAGGQPSRAPSRAYGVGTSQGSYPRALSPTPAPGRSRGGQGVGPAPSRSFSTPSASPSRSFSSPGPSPSRSFSSPGVSPSPRSMPSRGGMFSGGGSRGSSAPLRAPSRAPVQRGGSHVRGR